MHAHEARQRGVLVRVAFLYGSSKLTDNVVYVKLYKNIYRFFKEIGEVLNVK